MTAAGPYQRAAIGVMVDAGASQRGTRKMGISLQHELLRTEKLLSEVDRSFQVEGRLVLPADLLAAGHLQSCRARVRGLTTQVMSGQIRASGQIEVEVNYLSPVTEPESIGRSEYLAVWSKENGGALDFSQDLPIPGASGDVRAEAEAFVVGINTEPYDGGSLRCQISVNLNARLEQTQETKVATDFTATALENLGAAKEHLQMESIVGRTQMEAPVNTILALPETKTDLARVIARAVRLTDLTVEVIRGRAIVGGRMEVNMVYVAQAEDGGQTLETAEWGGEGRTPIGFEAFLDLPGLGPEVSVDPDVELGRLSLEPIGPREVRLEASVVVTIKASRVRQLPILTELTPGATEVIDTQRIEAEVTNLIGLGEQDLPIEATLDLPPGKPDLDKLLLLRVTPFGLTAQAAEGKCLVDGWLDVSILYLAASYDGNEPQLAAADWLHNPGTGVALSEVVDLPEASAGLAAGLHGRLIRFRAEPESPRTLRIHATLRAKVKVTEPRVVAAIVEAAAVPLAPIPGRPSMLFYVMQPGDSFWGIARRYETTVEALLRTNKIADPASVEIGRKLLIPRSPVAV